MTTWVRIPPGVLLKNIYIINGGVLKLVKRTVLKTVRSVMSRHGGSNPSTSANSIVMVKGYFDLLAHLVERKTDNFDVIGSIPI